MLPENMKFYVKNDEHSKEVQDALRKLGYDWEHETYKGKYMFTNQPVLWANSTTKAIYVSYSEAEIDIPEDAVACKVDYGCVVYVERHMPTVAEKPPIGLRPRKIVAQDRLVEILEAMLRYANEGKVIPDEWDNEYDELREYLNTVYEPSERLLSLMRAY